VGPDRPPSERHDQRRGLWTLGKVSLGSRPGSILDGRPSIVPTVDTLTFNAFGQTLEVTQNDNGFVVEMIERDKRGEVVRRWEATETPDSVSAWEEAISGFLA
jgi:hypothetical protein